MRLLRRHFWFVFWAAVVAVIFAFPGSRWAASAVALAVLFVGLWVLARATDSPVLTRVVRAVGPFSSSARRRGERA